MCFTEMKDKVGFRFRPNDEELINYYLKPKLQGRLVDKSIPVLEDFLKHEPWELAALWQSNDRFTYFIYPLGKYGNSKQARRKTKKGFWSATGKVRKVWTKKGTEGAEEIVTKRTLVFYKGPVSNKSKSSKTNWVKHEYRITSDIPNPNAYVICRLEKKADEKANTLTHDEVRFAESMEDLEQNIGCDGLGYNSCFEMPSQLFTKQGPSNQDLSLFNGFNSDSNGIVPLGTSDKIGTIQRRLAWPLGEDDCNGVQTFAPCYPVETIGHKNLVVESDGLNRGAVGMSSAQPLESLSGISYSEMSCDKNNEVAIAQGNSLSLGDLEPNIGCDELDSNLFLELPQFITKEGPFYPDLPTQFGTIESDGLDWGAAGISSAQLLESLSGISCIEDSGTSCDTNNEVAIAQGDSLSLGDFEPNFGCDELDYNLFLELLALFTKKGPFNPYLPTQSGIIESEGLDWGTAGISSAQPLESLSEISCIEDSGMSSDADNEVAIVEASEGTKLVTANDLPMTNNFDAKRSMKLSHNFNLPREAILFGDRYELFIASLVGYNITNISSQQETTEDPNVCGSQ